MARPLALPNCRRHIFLVLMIAACMTVSGCFGGHESGSSSSDNGSSGSNNSGTTTSSTTTSAAPASISISFPTPGFFAGQPAQSFAIAVANDVAGNGLAATESLNGSACTTSTCGTFGTVTGASGSGTYTLSYTPPTILTAANTVTLTVSSSLPGSFAATTNFIVYPAGTTSVAVTGIAARIQTGSSATANTTVKVYNDTVGNPGAQLSLLASGYACPPNGGGGTVCGTLTIGSTSAGTTSAGVPFTNTVFTYTPPASVPSSPYDRPMVLAVSRGNTSVLVNPSFQLSASSAGLLFIPPSSKLDVALTGSAAATIQATLNSDVGNSKTVNWTLTAGGTNCSPTCGTLGSVTYTRNGVGITATIPYTPPATVPASPDNQPTITATAVDTSSESDSFTFKISDGSCGTGNDGILNGQYAFLARGAAANNGYASSIGSFTADGMGHITGGSLDNNTTHNPVSGLSIVASGSSYTVGSDGRGCLILQNSNGGTGTYRIALGTLSSGVATQGRMIRFDDETGEGGRLSGVLMQQNAAFFSPSGFAGTYAFGFQGVDFNGHSTISATLANGVGRLVGGGLLTSDGVSTLSSVSEDTDDDGTASGNLTGGSGSFAIANNAANGRGTASLTVGGATSNLVLYVVSSSEILCMTTDQVGPNTPIYSGEMKQQTGGPFSNTSLNGSGLAFYASGVDTANGGNDIAVGQVTVTTNVSAIETIDENDNGTEMPEASGAVDFSIASNGRATLSSNAQTQAILYLVNPSAAFIVGVDNSESFGFAQKQSTTAFNNASFTGSYFFGADAPIIGSSLSCGTETFGGGGTVTAGTQDVAAPSPQGGLQTQAISPSTTYSLASSSTPSGRGNVGSNIAYAVSNSQVVALSTGASPQLVIIQK